MLLSSYLFLSLVYLITAQSCEDSFIVSKNGTDYLRLNATGLWACSNTNLCDKIQTMSTQIQALQGMGLRSNKHLISRQLHRQPKSSQGKDQ